MSEEREEVIVTSRQSMLRLAFWLKVIFTLGFYLLWWTNEALVVTNKRVIYRRVVIGKQEQSIPLGGIQDLNVSYGILGRFLGYGDVHIDSAGGPETEIMTHSMSRPDRIREALVQQMG